MILRRDEGYVAMTPDGRFLNADPTSEPTSDLQEAKFNPPLTMIDFADVITIKADRLVTKDIRVWDGKSDEAVVVTSIGTFAKDSGITDFVEDIIEACVFDVERATLACIEKGDGFYMLPVTINEGIKLVISMES